MAWEAKGRSGEGLHRSAGASRWFVRVSFALVFAVNVQCAVSFILCPERFVSAYELAGVPGMAAIQGIGVAFLMWNATYPLVIADPQRFKILAIVVLAQQAVGLVGESYILFALPSGHGLLAHAIGRFIAFDAAGLVLMASALVAMELANRARRRA